MRVKSKVNLYKLFKDKGYTSNMGGFSSPCRNYFINSDMLELSDTIIELNTTSGRIDYHYWSERWSWHKGWL